MTLQEFSDITVKVIRDNGIADYLPTLALPETKRIQAIQGIPSQVDHREAIQNVVRRSGFAEKEFFFGVRSSAQRITIGHYRPGQPTEFIEISETPDGYSATSVTSCDWWKLS